MTTTPTDQRDTTAPANGRPTDDAVSGPTTTATDSGRALDDLPAGPALIHLDLGGDSCLPGQLCD